LSISKQDRDLVVLNATGRGVKRTESRSDSKRFIDSLSRISSAKLGNPTTNPCPVGKEYKKTTRRCVNICKDGYERNADFKCIRGRNKTSKNRS